MNNLIVYGLSALAILGIFFLYLYSRKHPDERVISNPDVENHEVTQAQPVIEIEKTLKPDSNNPVNCLLLDNKTRSFGSRHIVMKQGKDYGRPVLYFNNLVFYLYKLQTGEILPVPHSPYQNLEHSPGEIFRAVKTFDYIREVFGRRDEKDHTKLWMILLLIGGVVFIAWMASSSKGN